MAVVTLCSDYRVCVNSCFCPEGGGVCLSSKETLELAPQEGLWLIHFFPWENRIQRPSGCSRWNQPNLHFKPGLHCRARSSQTGRKLIFFLPAPQRQIRIPNRGTSGEEWKASSLRESPAPAGFLSNKGWPPPFEMSSCKHKAEPRRTHLRKTTPGPRQQLKAGM